MSYVESVEPTYCTVEDVAETLDLPDDSDPMGMFMFSDVSHPSYSRVEKLILAAEDEIDRRTKRTWRENYVKDHVANLNMYWHDENGLRMDYYRQGGNYVQLRRDVRPWDPSKGDKLEIRRYQSSWEDITDTVSDAGGGKAWFDYPQGKLYMRVRYYQPPENSVRISYRFGSQEAVPMGINRLCCLLVASQIVNMSVFNIKVGLGGDIAGVRDSLLRNWDVEMGRLFTSFQRTGPVISMLR